MGVQVSPLAHAVLSTFAKLSVNSAKSRVLRGTSPLCGTKRFEFANIQTKGLPLASGFLFVYGSFMLTKQDLSDIQKVVQTETRKVILSETPKIVRDIVQSETPKIVRYEAHTILQQELKPIKEDIAKIRKDISVIVSFFDREYVELRRRVERIEHHLQLSRLPS